LIFLSLIFSQSRFTYAQTNSVTSSDQPRKAPAINPSASIDTELGFYPLRSPNIPLAVQAAAQKSVFKIQLPVEALASIDTAKNSLAELIETIQNDDKEFKPLWKESYIFQIKQCFADKLSVCPVLFNFSGGSGFLIRDDKGLIVVATAMHILKPYLRARIRALMNGQTSVDLVDLIKSIKIPLELYDANGRLLLSPKNGGAEIVGFNKSVIFELLNDDREIKNPYFDTVTLQLPIAIPNTPIEPASPDKRKLGENSFVAGYPGPSHDRAAFGRPDSDGQSLLFGYGKLTDSKSMLRSIGFSENDIAGKLKEEAAFIDKYLLISTADARSGDSGGALLAPDGKYLGIITSVPKEFGKIGPVAVPLAW
jgi:hypothetical protein